MEGQIQSLENSLSGAATVTAKSLGDVLRRVRRL